MRSDKTVFTTGDVARICNVAPRTVSKWFDSGQLRGYRIPGSKDRRIPLDQLTRFMRAHGIPLGELASPQTRVLILDTDLTLRTTLQKGLVDTGYEVDLADSAFEAGARVQEAKPRVLVVDMSLPDVEPKPLVRFIRTLDQVEAPQVIGTAIGLTDPQGQALIQEGLHGFIAKPFELRALITLIESLVSSHANI